MPLPGIVDHHGELIGMEAVGTSEHKIPDRLSDRMALPPLDPILEIDGLSRGAQTQTARASSGRQTVATGTGIDRPLQSNSGAASDLGATASAAIDQPERIQTGECRVIGVATRALEYHGLVPFEAKGTQCALNGLGGSVNLAQAVQILDAQQPDAILGTRVGITRDRCEQ
jgi:hypothetical protein